MIKVCGSMHSGSGSPLQPPAQIAGATIGRKLNSDRLAALASRFFVWGSLLRCEYGAAPQIQFNQRQKTSITVPSWLEADMRLIDLRCVSVFFITARVFA